MPQQTILRLQHPMVLVWERQKLARHTQLLQGIKHGQPLANGESIIELIMDYELRRCPVLNKDGRVPFGVTLTVFPDLASKLAQGYVSG